MVSHDRDFLNSVTTDIIHLHDLKLHYYRGNFAQARRSRWLLCTVCMRKRKVAGGCKSTLSLLRSSRLGL